MTFIADFHIHSHFSIATSKQLKPEYLDYWARLKGIKVVGTGDFTHPGWVAELNEKIEPAEAGLFKLKEAHKNNRELQTDFLEQKDIRFMLTAEISNIYKKNGKVRKVHNVIFAPDFETVYSIQNELAKIGANITSDGRPILGLDSRDLLEMCLECNENIFFVPAHIWTPWFSALGSKSGFDTIDECYDDLAHHIHAVETGLSSDAPMNWMCSFLDKYTLISNSDAHSPEKLGRNANIFDTELSYPSIINALKTGNPNQFLGTIDLFPQEGKYHYDGHRKCNICWDPVETLKHDGLCPQCGKKVVKGVMNRVVELSDREDVTKRPNKLPFYSIIPLKEILAEIEKIGPQSKGVNKLYFQILKKGFPELDILLQVALEEIKKISGIELFEAIKRMRDREIIIKEGFDGEYGQIKVFEAGEIPFSHSKPSLFKDAEKQTKPFTRKKRKIINFNLAEYFQLKTTKPEEDMQDVSPKKPEKTQDYLKGLNPDQYKAVTHVNGPSLIIAGPGTGKTRILTHRILYLILHAKVNPANILAVTFTNKAAQEIRERVEPILANLNIKTKPVISTFHSLGLEILKNFPEKCARKPGFFVLDDEAKKLILQRFITSSQSNLQTISQSITDIKQHRQSLDNLKDKELINGFNLYRSNLISENAFDLDDLIYEPAELFDHFPEVLQHYRQLFLWIMVDEYQDINAVQYRLLKYLMPHSTSNLCAIGDPNQAIYGFRGSDVAIMNRFAGDYKEAALFKLHTSYRCSDSILTASQGVITKKQHNSSALSGLNKGIKIKIIDHPTHKSEAEYIARTIEEMMGGLRFFSMDSNITTGHTKSDTESLADFAVLCRVKAQMEAIEKAFRDHSIPFQRVGNIPFFKEEPISFLVDLLKLSLNPGNRLLKTKLEKNVYLSGEILEEIIDVDKRHDSIAEGINFLYHKCLAKEYESVETQNNLNRFIDLAKDFNRDTQSFLNHLDLGKGSDLYKKDQEQVTLITMHSAKGLEFKAVFIPGCEEGILPYSLYKTKETDINEERRLLYVGMTRAEKYLFLSHAGQRFLRGQEYRLKRSHFLNWIERDLIQQSSQERRKVDQFTQKKLFEF